MLIRQLFISPGHNYFGHFGKPPDDYPLVEVPQIQCAAGRGIRGDRFFDYRKNYKGQITFFSFEVFEGLARHFSRLDKSPGVLRRNVVTSEVDLLSLIGQKFEIQGVRFLGTQHCAPCAWMNTALAPGAEQFLSENAGLRAQILTDGTITVGDALLSILPKEA